MLAIISIRPDKAPTIYILGIPHNFIGMKSTPPSDHLCATTTHDEPTSVTYMRT